MKRQEVYIQNLFDLVLFPSALKTCYFKIFSKIKTIFFTFVTLILLSPLYGFNESFQFYKTNKTI